MQIETKISYNKHHVLRPVGEEKETNKVANKKNNNTEISMKEASSKLDISESTVKKYIKDFGLEMLKGNGSKSVISEESFQALSEIVKLRANGLTIQEIKELKSQKPTRNILEEIEESQSTKKEDDSLPEEASTVLEESKEEGADLLAEILEPVTTENGTNGSEPTAESESDSEEHLKEDSDDQPQEQGQRRRRGFNYRYVERQIANDSKRVYSLRQRLRNPNMSVRDRLFFEEALERRILFLNGWKHILRWITK